MPLIHFAFGKLFRSGDEQDQLDSFIEHILLPKTLMASECKESSSNPRNLDTVRLETGSDDKRCD